MQRISDIRMSPVQVLESSLISVFEFDKDSVFGCETTTLFVSRPLRIS